MLHLKVVRWAVFLKHKRYQLALELAKTLE